VHLDDRIGMLFTPGAHAGGETTRQVILLLHTARKEIKKKTNNNQQAGSAPMPDPVEYDVALARIKAMVPEVAAAAVCSK
jgi:hypothetical protein